MSFPWAAVAAGGVQAGTGILAGAQNAQENNWARNFASDMASRDHQWAIEDWLRQNQRDDQLWDRENAKNLELWNMANAYNSPAEQMKRFRDAGLNPNLIYGQSNMGGSINAANINRSPVRNSSGANAGTGHTGGFEFLSQIVPTIMGMRQADATIDLTRAQTEATREEAALRSINQLIGIADIEGKGWDNKLKGLDYSFKSELNPISLQAQRLANVKLSKETQSIIQSIQESKQRVSASQQDQSRANKTLPYQLRNLDTQSTKNVNEGWRSAMDAYGKDLENKTREAGVNPNESWIYRMLGELMNSTGAGKPTYLR